MIFDAGGQNASVGYGVELTNYSGSMMLVEVAGHLFDDEKSGNFQADGGSEGASIEENNISDISVYPNPFTNIANVNFTVDGNKEVTVDVFNTVGQKVISNDLGTVSGLQNVQIDGTNLESGMYLINITMDGEVTTKKVSLTK